jgi:hypothetical protein
MSLTWAGFDRCVLDGDLGALTALLVAADEPARRVLGSEIEDRIRSTAPPPGQFPPGWSSGAYALVAIACLPSAARVAAVLGRREMRQWHVIPTADFLAIARSRELPWIGDLGVRLARRIRADELLLMAEWEFVVALLDEGGADPPATEGVVRAWLTQVHHGRSGGLLRRLRASRFLDLLLPAVFEIDGVGAHIPAAGWDGKAWDPVPGLPGAIVRLTAEGRLDRTAILAATVDRLTRGDRPAALRPFVLLHECLAPTSPELSPYTDSYAHMLSTAPSPIATLAQRVLRAVDPPLRTLLDTSAEVLVRPEKTLVKAHLAWLDKTAAGRPDQAASILEAVSAAFASPVLDIQDRALSVVARHLPRAQPSPETLARLAEAAAALTGDMRTRAAALLSPAATPGLAPAAPDLAPVGPDLAAAGLAAAGPGLAAAGGGQPGMAALSLPAPMAGMPAAIATAAELADEVVAVVRDPSGVRWERILSALVSLPTDGLTETFGPVLRRYEAFDGRWGSVPALAGAIRARAGLPPDDATHQRLVDAVRRTCTEMDHSLITTPADILVLRVAELAVQLARAPVPILLATPTHVTGSVDTGVLVDRLARFEEEGCTPWPLDFQQALLRVPRSADPSVLARARALTSPSGQQLARWLTTGGLPDPVSTRFVQQRRDPDGNLVFRRVVANLASGRTDDNRLPLEDAVVALTRSPNPYDQVRFLYTPEILAMVLPHHREVTAAWALPEIASLSDQDARDASLLPMLADRSGPIGPATILAVAYGLGARHTPDQVAAVDAFLILSTQPVLTAADSPAPTVSLPGADSFPAAVGAALGDLCSDGTVKLNRVVGALADAHGGGATDAVWRLLAAAIPPLLVTTPRGLPDLLELATHAATSLGIRADVPHLADLSRRSGDSRMLREAKRLHATLTRP